jgi:predicted nucleic acid-binding protein
VSFVLDSSVTLTWCFHDQRTPATQALLEQVAEDGAVVPTLWRLEVANGLQTALRRRRIDAVFRDASLEDLAALPITVDTDTHTHAWSGTLLLSDRFRLTVYDAAYLELAERRALPLASLDRELRAAAGALGVALLGIASVR